MGNFPSRSRRSWPRPHRKLPPYPVKILQDDLPPPFGLCLTRHRLIDLSSVHYLPLQHLLVTRSGYQMLTSLEILDLTPECLKDLFNLWSPIPQFPQLEKLIFTHGRYSEEPQISWMLNFLWSHSPHLTSFTFGSPIPRHLVDPQRSPQCPTILLTRLSCLDTELPPQNYFLDKLTHFKLTFTEHPQDNLYDLFQTCSTTLQKVTLDNRSVSCIHLHPRAFPVCPRLQILEVCGNCYVLKGSTSQNSVSSRFPSLTTLLLHWTPDNEFLNGWTDLRSSFTKVFHLQVLVVNGYRAPFNSESVTRIRRSFPNLMCLTVCLDVSQLSLLRFVFWTLTQLKHLQIILLDENQSGAKCYPSWEWEAVLLGTTPEMMGYLHKNPQLWKPFLEEGMTLESEDFGPGVRKLQQLQSFTLGTALEKENYQARILGPCSVLPFCLGFGRIGSLKRLTVDKALWNPSFPMVVWWRANGRKFSRRMPALN